MLEAALLRCRKRRCVEQEDYDLALEVKKLEQRANDRVETAKSRCQGGGGEDFTKEIEEIERQKRAALEEEKV